MRFTLTSRRLVYPLHCSGSAIGGPGRGVALTTDVELAHFFADREEAEQVGKKFGLSPVDFCAVPVLMVHGRLKCDQPRPPIAAE